MNISQNLVQQLITYLESRPDPMAKMLVDQLRYSLELHTEAVDSIEYRIGPSLNQVDLD